MKILAVGGGSGGHVTPAVAVLDELKRRHSDAEMRFWCDSGFAEQAGQIIAVHDASIRIQRVWAGKFRRYHHLTFVQHLMIPSIVLLNLRDILLIIAGFVQSLVRLIFWRPDVVFTKGGFVCLPVGWAAWCLRIPLLIHDSDVVPGLTNRLLASKAMLIATGAPLEHYPYDKAKSRYVGIPIDAAFRPYDTQAQRDAKQSLGFDPARPLVVVIGGGLGAKPLNDATAAGLTTILPHAGVLLIAGKGQYDALREVFLAANSSQAQLKAFVSDGIVGILGAADVVVSRAGATALLELAALHKATILVPSSRLVWQVQHAKLYAEKDAVVYLDETKFAPPETHLFCDTILGLIDDPARQRALSEAIAAMAMPGAAADVADMIEQAARR